MAQTVNIIADLQEKDRRVLLEKFNSAQWDFPWLQSKQSAMPIWRWGWDASNDPPFEDWLHGVAVSVWTSETDIAAVHFGADVALISLPESWKSFICDPASTRLVRMFVQQCAGLLGSTTCIYCPDSNFVLAETIASGVLGGESFVKICERMSQGINTANAFRTPPYDRAQPSPNCFIVEVV
jgi:hypothetical protein